EAAVGICRCADDWLASDVERSVDDDRAACFGMEVFEQCVEPSVPSAVDRLEASRVVDVGDGGDVGPLDCELVQSPSRLQLVALTRSMPLRHWRDEQHVREI